MAKKDEVREGLDKEVERMLEGIFPAADAKECRQCGEDCPCAQTHKAGIVFMDEDITTTAKRLAVVTVKR